MSFTYDTENRLTGASGAKTAQLIYDPLGRLYETNNGSGGGVTRFLYDGDALVAEYDGSGNITARYVHGSGVDQPVVWYDGSAVSSTTRRHLFANWQGSITAVTDSTGNAIAVNAYDAHGIPNPDNLGRFQYTGQIWLPGVGLYHYKARAYSPFIGRFLQTDPVGYDDQFNLYTYVGNDPVGKVDPNGTDMQTVIRMKTTMRNVNNAIIDFFTEDAIEAWNNPSFENVTIAVATSAFKPAKIVRKLLKEARSLEKGARSKIDNANDHEKRASAFEKNPTVKPEMKGQSPEKIAAQQKIRPAKLRAEAARFRQQAADDLAKAKKLREEAAKTD